MPTIKIPPGVVRGETLSAVPGRWHVANLVRWQSGRMAPVGGWERITETPLLAIPRSIFVWLDSLSDRHMAVICDDKVFDVRGSQFIDITPGDFIDANSTAAQGYGSGQFGVGDFGNDDEPRGAGGFTPDVPIKFSMDNWGDELLFSSSADGRVFVYDPVEQTPPVVAPGVPTFVKSMVVTEEHHVMVFGVQGYPNRVAWSDQDNREGWDFTDVTGQAGFFDLEGAGHIVSATKIAGGILIFTSTSVWLGRYIGAPYYYGFNKIAEECGPLSAHAIAVAGNRAFWMGIKNFWKYEGGVVSVLNHTLGTEVFEDMAEAAPRRACAGYNGRFPEIWFFYPTKTNNMDTPVYQENDKYIIFGFEPGAEWWADGDMARSCFTSSPHDSYPFAGGDNTHIYQHERGWRAEGQSRVPNVYAETGALAFDDAESVFSVHQCQVDNATGVDGVAFDFKGNYVRGGPVYDLQIGLLGRPDGWLDTHFSAREFVMRVTGRRNDAWALGAMQFHTVKRRGRR